MLTAAHPNGYRHRHPHRYANPDLHTNRHSYVHKYTYCHTYPHQYAYSDEHAHTYQHSQAVITPSPPPVTPSRTPPTRTFSVPYIDEVTCNQTNWRQSGLWHISAQRSHSPDCAWWYGQETSRSYNTGKANSGNLTSPPIALASAQLLTLRFATRWQVEAGRPEQDVMLVQIQGNDGAWQTLRHLRREGVALPSAEKWRIETIDLSAYAGQTIQVRFRFDTVDAGANNFEGWWVDDIGIEGEGVDSWPLYLPETGGVKR